MPNTGATNHLDTLPKLLFENYRKHPSRVAMRKKDFGIWNPYPWEDCYINIKYFALGLKEMGFQPGDKVSIVGDNEPEWYWSELAAQVASEILASGLDRTLEISYSEFEGQVVEFLSDEARSRFGSPSAWEGIQLAVAQGIESVISAQTGSL